MRIIVQIMKTNCIILIIAAAIIPITAETQADECLEDYDPCVCVEAGNGLVLYCDRVTISEALDVFNRTTAVQEFHQIVFTLFPDEQQSPPLKNQVVIAEDFLNGKRSRSIFLSCPVDISSYELVIHRDAFRSSSDYTQQLYISGCDLSWWNFTFLEDFTRMSDVKILNSINVHSFWLLPPLPAMTELTFDQCSGLQGLAFPARSLPGLERLYISNNQLDDRTVDSILGAISSSPASNKLQWLDLTRNLLTKVPVQIPLFADLKFLYLQENQISKLASGSLSMAGDVDSLFLSRNSITFIESNAFKGNFSRAAIFIDQNGLTRFEAGVFQAMLEQMVRQGDGRGQVYLYGDPIECDCHLAWLVRDNRDLLSATFSGSCSNGTQLQELRADGLADCDPVPSSSSRLVAFQLLRQPILTFHYIYAVCLAVIFSWNLSADSIFPG